MANAYRSVLEGEHEKRRVGYEESMREERVTRQVRACLFIYKTSLSSILASRKFLFVNVARPKHYVQHTKGTARKRYEIRR